MIGGDEDDSDGGGGDLFSATTTLGASGFLSGSGLLGDPTPDSSSAVFGNGSRAMESSGLFEQVDEEKERQERFRREALKQERRMAEEREREDLLKREEAERQRVAQQQSNGGLSPSNGMQELSLGPVQSFGYRPGQNSGGYDGGVGILTIILVMRPAMGTLTWFLQITDTNSPIPSCSNSSSSSNQTIHKANTVKSSSCNNHNNRYNRPDTVEHPTTIALPVAAATTAISAAAAISTAAATTGSGTATTPATRPYQSGI